MNEFHSLMYVYMCVCGMHTYTGKMEKNKI
jgi:hypothetical protein